MNGTDSHTTVVIGGGIVGWATAFGLVSRGIETTVIDAGHAEAATMAGAGIITLGTSQNLPEAYIELATQAIAYYPALVHRLEELDAGDTGYARVGALHVAFSDDKAANLDVVADRLRSRRTPEARQLADIRIITGDDARNLVPPLSPAIPAAVWYADAARVNGRLMRGALRTAALGLGCTEIQGAAQVERFGEYLVVTVPDGSRIQPEHLVIASGAWSTDLFAGLNLDLPVVPQRGQIAHIQWHDESTERWPSVETESRFYMLAFPGGRVVSGATRELDVGFDPRLTAAGMHEVLSQALRIAPGLGDCTVVEFRVGLRPFSPDGRPFIGPIPSTRNGWICTGHGPSGLTIGPWSGDKLASMISGEASALDMSPYAIASDRGAI